MRLGRRSPPGPAGAGASQASAIRFPSTRLARRLRLTRARHNLPSQLTSFIGREREIAGVRTLLAATRLLTLTGGVLLLFALSAVDPAQTGASLLLVPAFGLVLGLVQDRCGSPAPRLVWVSAIGSP